ncbi:MULTISPECIES: hypothetical protein [Rhizobium/Agrobacterium group]|uniref:hypothetical protein n=1 Tax=Rhizobium/Agrobacterium group TaxID=227290 RepID=UPI0005A16DAA|nr:MULTISPECIES: hypothetical protein [Rhizobium/Agrobacterium group]MUO30825.1 hypothetical protein [Agrobacterium vitis]
MLDAGTYGAKVQSWKRYNPRELLIRVMDDHAGADKQAILSALRDALLLDDGPDYLDAIIEYWFSNNYNSIVTRPSLTVERKTTVSLKARADTLKAKVKAKIIEEAKMILMDMIMPNGKPLRDCTARDCEAAGGWLQSLASLVPPDEKVGSALTENDVRKAFQGAQESR